jgi:hypothetical protein
VFGRCRLSITIERKMGKNVLGRVYNFDGGEGDYLISRMAGIVKDARKQK